MVSTFVPRPMMTSAASSVSKLLGRVDNTRVFPATDEVFYVRDPGYIFFFHTDAQLLRSKLEINVQGPAVLTFTSFGLKQGNTSLGKTKAHCGRDCGKASRTAVADADVTVRKSIA